jgi:hypothetical protein
MTIKLGISLGTPGDDPQEDGSRAAEPATQEPPSTDRDVYHALFRNMSERPAAVVDVALARANGEELVIRRREYARRLALPIVLGPWGVAAVELQVDYPELRDADVLVVRDMDDKEIRVPLRDPSKWQQWFRYA